MKGFSPRYTAPEVFGRMTTNVSMTAVEHEMKSDVYSYSVILWEMLTRKTPWANCKYFNSSFDPFYFYKKKERKKNVVKETSDIDFQVRSGKREVIPDSQGDKVLEMISMIIELSWKQNPNERPTFQQIEQKLTPSVML